MKIKCEKFVYEREENFYLLSSYQYSSENLHIIIEFHLTLNSLYFFSSLPQAASTKVHSIDNQNSTQHHASSGKRQNVLHDKSPLGTNILGNIFVKKGKKSGKHLNET